VKHTIGAKILEIIALLGMGFTGKHPILGYTYGYFNIHYFWFTTFRMWGWLHYNSRKQETSQEVCVRESKCVFRLHNDWPQCCVIKNDCVLEKLEL